VRFSRVRNRNTSSNHPGAIVIEGHVQGLSNVRSLGEIGIPVYVLDKTNCIARYSKYCTGFWICPDFAEEEFAKFLMKLAISESLQDWILIPSNDHAVVTISRFKKELENYYRVITPGIKTIDKIIDKSKLNQLAEKIQVPSPKTIKNSSETPKIFNDFPALIKGRTGLSFYRTIGKKAFLVKDSAELKEKLSLISSKIELSNTITQELIPNDGGEKTISFTAFAEKGEIKTYWIGEKVREHPVNFGTATFCKVIENHHLLKPSNALLKELGYTGVCEIEYLRDPRDNQYKLIEINPRTWLWVGLAKVCKVDYAKLIYDYFHGSIKFPVQDDILTNLSWANFATDFLFSLHGIIKREIKLREVLRSYQTNVVRAVHSHSDIRPGISYLFFLIKYIRTR